MRKPFSTRLIAKSRQAIGSVSTKIVVPIAILFCASAIFLALKNTKPEIQNRPAQERVWGVKTVRVEIGDVSVKHRFYGQVVAGRVADLRAEVNGRVLTVNNNFKNGGIVSRSDILVRIDPLDYQSDLIERENELAEAEASFAELKADYDGTKKLLKFDKEQTELRQRETARLSRLIKRKNISEQRFDEAKMALSQTRQNAVNRERLLKKIASGLDKQLAVINRRAEAVKRAKRKLSSTRLLAPFDGFLKSVETAPGRYVSIGTPLGKIIQAKDLEVKFQIGNREFGELSRTNELVRKKVDVLWQSGGKRQYTAIVRRYDSSVDPDAGGINLYAQLEGLTRNSLLRPGIFVEIYFTGKLQKQVMRLPETALHGDKVYVILGDRLTEKKVEVVLKSGTDILVKGEIANGDKVVVTRLSEIGPGLKVVER